MSTHCICTSATMANKLPENLYRFCREIAKKKDLKCIYETVKKTDKYNDRKFVLNNKPVSPEIYTGIWFDDGLWDHRGDGDFWWTTNAKIYVIAKVDGRFYVPDSSSYEWEEVDQYDLENDGIDIINDRRLTFEYVSYYDMVEEQCLNDEVQLTELYHKVKLDSEMFKCVKKYCYEKNLVCMYSGVKEIPYDYPMYKSEYYCCGEEIKPTKIYVVRFFDKNSKTVSDNSVAYDFIYTYIVESDGKFYILDEKFTKSIATHSDKKFIHLANKNKLLPTKITKIGKMLIQKIEPEYDVEQM